MQNSQINFNLVQKAQEIKCSQHPFNTISLLNTTSNALKGERLLCHECDTSNKKLIFFQKAQEILINWHDQEMNQIRQLENHINLQQFLQTTQTQAEKVFDKLSNSLILKHKQKLEKCLKNLNNKSERIQALKNGFIKLEKTMENYLDKAKAQSELEPIFRQLITDDPLTHDIITNIGKLISQNLINGVPSEKFKNRKIDEQRLHKIQNMQEKLLKSFNDINRTIINKKQAYKSQQIKYMPIFQKEQLKLTQKMKFLQCKLHQLPIEIINITPEKYGQEQKLRGQCTKCDIEHFQFPQKVEELLFNWYQQESNQINRYLDLINKQQFIEKVINQLEQIEVIYKQLVNTMINFTNLKYQKLQTDIKQWFEDIKNICSTKIKNYEEQQLIGIKNKFTVYNFITRFNKPQEQISQSFMQDIAIFLSQNYQQNIGYVYLQLMQIDQKIVNNIANTINQCQLYITSKVNSILYNYNEYKYIDEKYWHSPATLSVDMKMITQITQSGLILLQCQNQQIQNTFNLQNNINLNTLSISSNNLYLAYGIINDNQIHVYQLTDNKLITLSGHKKIVKQLKFTSNSEYLFSSSSDNTIKQWNIKSGNSVKTFDFCNIIFGFALSNTFLAVVGDSINLNIWKIASSLDPLQFQIDSFCAYAIDISKTQNYIATGGSDLIIMVWDIRSCVNKKITQIKQLKGHQNYTKDKQFHQILFSPEEKYLFSSSFSDNTLIIWDLSQSINLQIIPIKMELSINTKKIKYANIYLSQDTNRIIISDGDQYIKKYEKIRNS